MGQSIPKVGPRLMNPHTRTGICLLHGAIKIASQPPMRDLTIKLLGKPAKGPDLTRYRASLAMLFLRRRTFVVPRKIVSRASSPVGKLAPKGAQRRFELPSQ